MIPIGILTIVILLIVVIIINKYFLVKNVNPMVVSEKPEEILPDYPVSFGYKIMWIAVKTDNKNRIAEILNLKKTSDCNWQDGIAQAYSEGSVFITPPIDGWTLACGRGLPAADNKESLREVKSILEVLSKEFGEAQFFCTHRVVEFHCWIKSTKGNIDRVYSYLGESGENIAIEGEPTEFEQILKLANTFSEEAKNENYFEREDVLWPDEETVMQIAEHWSVNPTTLEDTDDIAPSLGLIGYR